MKLYASKNCIEYEYILEQNKLLFFIVLSKIFCISVWAFVFSILFKILSGENMFILMYYVFCVITLCMHIENVYVIQTFIRGQRKYRILSKTL